MNWKDFQTYNMAPEKAFEVLCNQLFENWGKEEYKLNIDSMRVVNGAGGDGGVESYIVLKDGSIIGLQAKWFPTSMTSSQITQIRNSIKTAKELRPKISRYIVCVPRDLSSKTAPSKTAEDERWDRMISAIGGDYLDLTVELWNETRLLVELQKPASAGIFRFWFEKSELSDEKVHYAFEKAKKSWLITKYIPNLNTFGDIAQIVYQLLGEIEEREKQATIFQKIYKLCSSCYSATEDLLSVCGNQPELTEILTEIQNGLRAIEVESSKIISWYRAEIPLEGSLDVSVFHMKFDSIANSITEARNFTISYSHAVAVTKILKRLGGFDYDTLIKNFEQSHRKKSLLFLGIPGTGKTHGIGALSEKLLSDGLHIPLLIQARSVSLLATWKNIVCDYLGLSSNWNEDELWQALISLANRHKFQEPYLSAKINISPKVIIFVDGLDESSAHEKWGERIREANVITEHYPQIKFCFTARPTAFDEQVDYAAVERLNNSGDVPTHVLFERYMDAYNIKTQNNGWLKYCLTTPLALKLFCEIHRDQTITLSSRTEVSMTALWRRKIEEIEEEYRKKINSKTREQYVLCAVNLLSKRFVDSARLEYSTLLHSFTEELKMNTERAGRLIECLERYGILNYYREQGTGCSPDKFFYFPGIQGYFDYAAALSILSQYGHPRDIDFNAYKAIQKNTLNSLAIISIQNYQYLLTTNPTIDAVSSDWLKMDLCFLALLHTDYETALQFKGQVMESMSKAACNLIMITNELVLPLSRDVEHPLGVMLLDEFLNRFEKPAQRDILWSIPGYLRNAVGKRWHQGQNLALEDEKYLLDNEDTHNGCPTVYAWALSSLDNSLRSLYCARLLDWACLVPKEFYKLFLKFSSVNDPQIKSDMFSILVTVIYSAADKELVKKASDWILENILHPEKIDENRDISVRHYSIAVIKKAAMIGVLDEKEIMMYLPPYTVTRNTIALNKGALKGTRMGGYRAITYDLSRYVLVDDIVADFNSHQQRATKQFEELLDAIVSKQPEYAGMTVEQFVISAAYAYILEMGWDEQNVSDLNGDESGELNFEEVDCSIQSVHDPATHGSQSSFMTVCEKYIWQARNVIRGFLCDRLLFGDENIPVTDYSLVDDFIIPLREKGIIAPYDIPEDRPWHIPESEKAILEDYPTSAKDVKRSISHAPVLDWEKWIFFKNVDSAYKVNSENLVALSMCSDFSGSAGVETCLFINAILVNEGDVATFVNEIEKKAKTDCTIANPTEWYGNIPCACYITPQEACWFSWKGHRDPEWFGQFRLNSAVDSCCRWFSKCGEVSFSLPSPSVRKFLDIIDSDNYLFFDKSGRTVAEYSIAGEKWETYQSCVVVDRDLLFERMRQSGQALVWLMRERRFESIKSKEKFGEFHAERERSYVGCFDQGRFSVKEIYSEAPSFESKQETKTET